MVKLKKGDIEILESCVIIKEGVFKEMVMEMLKIDIPISYIERFCRDHYAVNYGYRVVFKHQYLKKYKGIAKIRGVCCDD